MDPAVRAPRASSRTSAPHGIDDATPTIPGRSPTWATGRRDRGRGSRASRATTPKLIALPTIGDLQTLTYRNDVFTDARRRPGTTSSPRARPASRPARSSTASSSAASRATRSSPRSTRSSCRSGRRVLRRQVERHLQLGQGQGGGRLLRRHPEVDRPARRRGVRLRPGGRGDPRRRRGAIIQYSGNAIKSDDPAQSKEVGKLDFGVVPKQETAHRPDRHLHPRRPRVGAEQGQRHRLHEVVRQQ